MIKYKYNGVEYPNLSVLRQAVWEHEHKAYGKFSVQDQFAKAGIDIEFVEVPDPELPQFCSCRSCQARARQPSFRD